VVRLRNYYGVYRVYDRDGLRYLQHGTTQHGRQYLSGPKQTVPLAYFHPSAPAGRALTARAFPAQKVGMIGLGTGALATYFGTGQSFRVFELDPDNLPIAENHFSYLQQARDRGAELSFVFGDGRVSMRREPASSYDLVIIDAFNSGSIPVHLLTVEAMAEYFRILKPNGVLLMHVSNRVLDLEPVVYANAETLGITAAEASNSDAVHPDAEMTQWMALCRDPEVHKRLAELGWLRLSRRKVAPWTDQYSDVVGAMLR
jgi:spermidine synthase